LIDKRAFADVLFDLIERLDLLERFTHRIRIDRLHFKKRMPRVGPTLGMGQSKLFGIATNCGAINWTV
jgi:hypothetical protein